MAKIIFLAVFLLASCGAKSLKPSSVDYPALAAEVARVEPLLSWRCGAPVASNVQDECDLDSASMLGAYIYNAGEPERYETMLAMLDNGVPTRAPNKPVFEPGRFSRDAALGYVQASVGAGNPALVRALDAYISATGRLCAGDDRCNLTPSVRLLIHEAMGYKPTLAERALDEATIATEASTTPPSYRTYLVLRKLDVHFKLSGASVGYRHALDIVLKRYPQGVYQKILKAEIDGASLVPVAEHLTKCLQRFPQPRREDWIGNAIDVECSQNPMGHELVMLAKRILK